MKLNRVNSLEGYLENNASDFDASVNRYANNKSNNTAWQ